MKTVRIIVPLGLFFALVSCCGRQGVKQETYGLVKSEATLSFPLDDRTKNFILALFPYTDEDGTEYLTFQNQGRNELLFYKMNTQQLAFKINPELQGNQGVGRTIGYYIHNSDSIFLTSAGTGRITLIDRDARIKDRFRFSRTDNGAPLQLYNSITSTYKPMVVLDNKMYICPEPNRGEKINPVCATIHLSSHSVQALPGFPYPVYPELDKKARSTGVEMEFSRCYNGRQFIYSFFYEEDVYVTSSDHTSVERVRIKSKYINRVNLPEEYNLTMEKLCELPKYGNLLYDPYREVYYRIAYPGTELEKGVRAMELLQYGRRNFSIILLDKDLHILGETLFPDYTYNSTLLFIREDGLYLSASHFMNPEFSDDLLVFHRFDLVKKE
ncbi:MAG: DUF4221 domain-containing protein [Tannerellaceae bacterium]|jgi:hypothetical protein|nr:DUF4221 domain-containing protein [Tannerellaceae bacterium]